VNDERLSAYIAGMLQAAKDAVDYAEGLTRTDFLGDKRTQHAIALNFIIIGECAARIIHQFPDFVRSAPEIAWIKIRGMRNQVAHFYFDIDLDIIWDTVQDDLPGLITNLNARKA
jgi:uncharacterized protein with HEPN domain